MDGKTRSISKVPCFRNIETLIRYFINIGTVDTILLKYQNYRYYMPEISKLSIQHATLQYSTRSVHTRAPVGLSVKFKTPGGKWYPSTHAIGDSLLRFRGKIPGTKYRYLLPGIWCPVRQSTYKLSIGNLCGLLKRHQVLIL